MVVALTTSSRPGIRFYRTPETFDILQKLDKHIAVSKDKLTYVSVLCSFIVIWSGQATSIGYTVNKRRNQIAISAY